MNEKLNECCARLEAEIQAAQAQMQQVGQQMASAVEDEVAALEMRLKDAVTKRESKRERATQAGQRIKDFLEEAKNSVVTRIEDWRTDREISKLEDHANKQEQQAVDAIVVAAFAILEAEVAIVDALKARKIAIEVAG